MEEQILDAAIQKCMDEETSVMDLFEVLDLAQLVIA